MTDPGPFLALALQYDRPTAPAERLALGGAPALAIGRGKRREVTRDPAGWTWAIDDAWMSTTHARVRLDGARWWVEDTDSRNGVFVNRARVSRAVLADGDRVEIGDTMFVFIEASGGAPSPHLVVEATGATPAALWTLSPRLRADLEVMVTVAGHDVPILVSGPTGSGKEVTARAIHALSRRPGPFVRLEGASIPAAHFERELFGLRRGGFSETDRYRPGLLAAADDGTLFLDEIGDLSPVAQDAFSRVLETHTVVPVGGGEAVPLSMRVVATTRGDVDAQILAGGLREELVARLSGGHHVRLPALRDRREDLGLLIAAVLGRIAGERAPTLKLAREAGAMMFSYPWPENVHELEHTLRIAVGLADDDVITSEAIGRTIGDTAVGTAAAKP